LKTSQIVKSFREAGDDHRIKKVKFKSKKRVKLFNPALSIDAHNSRLKK